MEPRDISVIEDAMDEAVRDETRAMGFTEVRSGVFYHPDLGMEFDFSATAPGKVLRAVWNTAVKHGKNLKVRAIKRELTEEKIG